MDLEVHHIGYAVSNMENGKDVFEKMGYVSLGDIVSDEIRNIRILFMKMGETVIELVQPNGEGNPVDGTLKKNGSCPYHICYKTDDINKSIDELKKEGFMVIKKPEIAPAIDNNLVAFLYNIKIGLIELVEMKM